MAFKKEGAEFTDTVRFKDYALSFAAEEASRFSKQQTSKQVPVVPPGHRGSLLGYAQPHVHMTAGVQKLFRHGGNPRFVKP